MKLIFFKLAMYVVPKLLSSLGRLLACGLLCCAVVLILLLLLLLSLPPLRSLR